MKKLTFLFVAAAVTFGASSVFAQHKKKDKPAATKEAKATPAAAAKPATEVKAAKPAEKAPAKKHH